MKPAPEVEYSTVIGTGFPASRWTRPCRGYWYGPNMKLVEDREPETTGWPSTRTRAVPPVSIESRTRPVVGPEMVPVHRADHSAGSVLTGLPVKSTVGLTSVATGDPEKSALS